MTRTDETTFHLGEQAIQKRLGVYEEIGPWASKVVRSFLPDQHRDFYCELPFLVAAARDGGGRPWVTLLTGKPGFARSPDASRLSINAHPARGDALDGEFVPGSPLGLLGIELAERRRNRVNGVIGKPTSRANANADTTVIELEVGQSFGNCPQYIREREWEYIGPPPDAVNAAHSDRFDAALQKRIESADTFFIATGHEGDGSAPSHGMDASHRGGSAGFVRIENEKVLMFPDYAGNKHFNTLGNLEMDPRAGLLFVDFESGGMLQLTGRATVDWNSPEISKIPGAQRLVRFELDQAIDLPAVLPIRWRTSEENVRELEVVEKRRESDDVMSFVFAPRDGVALTDFTPGQYLPIELDVESESAPIRRTYSLSNGPGGGKYRISVKRESHGMASRHLHDAIEVGDSIRSRAPAGDFVLEETDRPIVCLSAGIGVTPMISMLRTHVATNDHRPIAFLHVARDGAHHPFVQEVRELIDAAQNSSVHISYSRPGPADVAGRDFDAAGRLDTARVTALVPDLGADFYLCGPVPFMAELTQGLMDAGVSANRVHSESFGPTTIL